MQIALLIAQNSLSLGIQALCGFTSHAVPPTRTDRFESS